MTQMHADMNALHVHGPLFGIDTDPIRATYAHQEQIERRFEGHSADPEHHATHHGGSDLDVDPGRMVHNLPNRSYDSLIPKRPRMSAEFVSNVDSCQSGNILSLRKSRSRSIASATSPQRLHTHDSIHSHDCSDSIPSQDEKAIEDGISGPSVQCPSSPCLQIDFRRPIRRVHGKKNSKWESAAR